MATICPYKPERKCRNCIHYRSDFDSETGFSCYLAEDLRKEKAYDDMILNDPDAQLLFGR